MLGNVSCSTEGRRSLPAQVKGHRAPGPLNRGPAGFVWTHAEEDISVMSRSQRECVQYMDSEEKYVIETDLSW